MHIGKEKFLVDSWTHPSYKNQYKSHSFWHFFFVRGTHTARCKSTHVPEGRIVITRRTKPFFSLFLLTHALLRNGCVYIFIYIYACDNVCVILS